MMSGPNPYGCWIGGKTGTTGEVEEKKPSSDAREADPSRVMSDHFVLT